MRKYYWNYSEVAFFNDNIPLFKKTKSADNTNHWIYQLGSNMNNFALKITRRLIMLTSSFIKITELSCCIQHQPFSFHLHSRSATQYDASCIACFDPTSTFAVAPGPLWHVSRSSNEPSGKKTKPTPGQFRPV